MSKRFFSAGNWNDTSHFLSTQSDLRQRDRGNLFHPHFDGDGVSGLPTPALRRVNRGFWFCCTRWAQKRDQKDEGVWSQSVGISAVAHPRVCYRRGESNEIYKARAWRGWCARTDAPGPTRYHLRRAGVERWMRPIGDGSFYSCMNSSINERTFGGSERSDCLRLSLHSNSSRLMRASLER